MEFISFNNLLITEDMMMIGQTIKEQCEITCEKYQNDKVLMIINVPALGAVLEMAEGMNIQGML
jgi:hypothetical protein